MNNIALFVTHSVFLTDEEARLLASGESSVETTGHCVPVWVEAKTGRTTEPGNEIFCQYRLHNSKDQEKEIKIMPRKGYEIFLPHSSWTPPTDFDYEKISVWPSEERIALMKEMDKWWFSNPRPPDASDIAKGYLRFDLRRTDRKGKKSHQEQHVIEISKWDRLIDSLAT